MLRVLSDRGPRIGDDGLGRGIVAGGGLAVARVLGGAPPSEAEGRGFDPASSASTRRRSRLG